MAQQTVAEAKKRMEKVQTDLRAELATLRTGRASLTLLDHIRFDYYGTPTPLKEAAKLSISDPTTLAIQPFDPSILADIEKAIRTADLGLNPQNDGKVIRVPIPPLTDERRKEMVKHLHKVLETHRTGVRNIRRDVNDDLKKALKEKTISEDDERRAMEEVQRATDAAIAHIDEMGKNKEKEITTI